MIVGYAAVFNKLSVDLGGFRERIEPGAFRQAIQRGDDVRALLNHDPSLLLGRTRSRTVTLEEDDVGLLTTIRPPDTELGRSTVESIRRGDRDGMSFGFIVREERFNGTGNEVVRTVLEAELFDVTVATYPAYPDTKVAVRSFQAWKQRNQIPSRSAIRNHRLCDADCDMNFRGRRLASVLNQLIKALESEDRPRSDIIAAIGDAAGIDAATVNEILERSINCPPINRLRGFARVLNTSLGRLQAAAESDGCDYDE